MIRWDDSENSLWLFTVDEFNKLPDGIILECIDGSFATKGVDRVDKDVRFACIAYGVRNPMVHPEHELFTIFRLS